MKREKLGLSYIDPLINGEIPITLELSKILTLNFGKYKNKPVYEVILERPRYTYWLIKERILNFDDEVKNLVLKLIDQLEESIPEEGYVSNYCYGGSSIQEMEKEILSVDECGWEDVDPWEASCFGREYGW